MGPYKATCLEAIQQYYPDFDTTWSLLFLGSAVSISSILCASLLVDDIDGWSRSALRNFNFTHGCVDLLYLSVFQIIAITSVTVLARRAQRKPRKNRGCLSGFFSRTSFRYFLVATNGDTKEPLLEDEVEEEKDGDGNLLCKEITVNSNSKQGQGQGQEQGHEGYEDEDRRIRDQSHQKIDSNDIAHKKRTDTIKSYYLALVFLISTGIQVYTGLKCISFEFDNEMNQGAMMGLNVLWVNVMVWISRELIKKGVDDIGILIPNLHKHRLHLDLDVHSHWCDLCGQRCKEIM